MVTGLFISNSPSKQVYSYSLINDTSAMTESLVIELPVPATASIGERIFYCRKKAKLSQAELGEALGITQGGVAWWEKQGSYPKTELLMPLARLFNVSVEWLLEGVGPAPEVQPVNKSESKAGKMAAGEPADLAGLSPLQAAAIDALTRAFRKGAIPNSRCLELLNEWEKLADS
jgi:transcriptional regulator with XRE-family HTH domain